MSSTKAIASFLRITEQAITRVENWANCFFVVFKGGCRFVSKKIIEAIESKLPEIVSDCKTYPYPYHFLGRSKVVAIANQMRVKTIEDLLDQGKAVPDIIRFLSMPKLVSAEYWYDLIQQAKRRDKLERI